MAIPILHVVVSRSVRDGQQSGRHALYDNVVVIGALCLGSLRLLSRKPAEYLVVANDGVRVVPLPG